jgi:hypothetical protein
MPIDASKRNTEIELERVRAKAIYPELWRNLITEWKQADQEDAVWLTYAANYLFNTAGVRWAMDPFSLFSRIGGGRQPDFAHDLDTLQLVVLTHGHNDHLDLNLISAIQSLPITWVIPEFLLNTIKQSVSLDEKRILVPQIGRPIEFENLTLHPFEGLHLHFGSGVPEMGFLVEFNDKRWLFPIDTRKYEPESIVPFAAVSGVFAHLWLGKARALEDHPPLLENFCKFHTAARPERIIVTHLRELGRKAEDYWDLSHYEQVVKIWKEMAPSIRVMYALMGQKVGL